MSSVPFPLAAMAAIEAADVSSASLRECAELEGHIHVLREWLDDFEARAAHLLAAHNLADQSDRAQGFHDPVLHTKTTVPYPLPKVGS
jgi:hypothetical protein